MCVQCLLCGVEWINCSDSTRVMKLKQFNVNVTTICAILRTLHAFCIYSYTQNERFVSMNVSSARCRSHSAPSLRWFRCEDMRNASRIPRSNIIIFIFVSSAIRMQPPLLHFTICHRQLCLSLLLSNDDKNGVSSLTNRMRAVCGKNPSTFNKNVHSHTHTLMRHRSVRQQWFLVRLNTFLLTYSRCMHTCSCEAWKWVCVGVSSIVSLLFEQIIRSVHITYEHVHACLNRRLYADKQTKWILAFFAGIRKFSIHGTTPAAVTVVAVCLMCVLSLEGIYRLRSRLLNNFTLMLFPSSPSPPFFLIYFIDVIYGFFKHNFAEAAFVWHFGNGSNAAGMKKKMLWIQIHSYEEKHWCLAPASDLAGACLLPPKRWQQR